MNVTEILCLLQQVKQNNPNQWTARCPAHDDRTPSLSVSVGDGGRILLHCHAHAWPMHPTGPGYKTLSATPKPRWSPQTNAKKQKVREVRRQANLHELITDNE